MSAQGVIWNPEPYFAQRKNPNLFSCIVQIIWPAKQAKIIWTARKSQAPFRKQIFHALVTNSDFTHSRETTEARDMTYTPFYEVTRYYAYLRLLSSSVLEVNETKATIDWITWVHLLLITSKNHQAVTCFIMAC